MRQASWFVSQDALNRLPRSNSLIRNPRLFFNGSVFRAVRREEMVNLVWAEKCFGSGSVFTETRVPTANSTMGFFTFRLYNDSGLMKRCSLPARLAHSFGPTPHTFWFGFATIALPWCDCPILHAHWPMLRAVRRDGPSTKNKVQSPSSSRLHVVMFLHFEARAHR